LTVQVNTSAHKAWVAYYLFCYCVWARPRALAWQLLEFSDILKP
jgi:hypothetical protein